MKQPESSSRAAYEVERSKRKDLDKGGLECGYAVETVPECPALPECDEMNKSCADGMVPEGAYPIKKT